MEKLSNHYIRSGPWPAGKLFYYPAYMERIIALATVAFTSIDEACTDPAMCLHYE